MDCKIYPGSSLTKQSYPKLPILGVMVPHYCPAFFEPKKGGFQKLSCYILLDSKFHADKTLQKQFHLSFRDRRQSVALCAPRNKFRLYPRFLLICKYN